MDLGASSADTAVDLAEYGEEDNMSVSGEFRLHPWRIEQRVC